MTQPAYSLKHLLDSWSNYDQQVDVVCCWHGRFEGFVGEGDFDHYPSYEMPDGRTLTPDFVVSFDGYRLVGEICRLPRQPEGFTASVEQAKGYLSIGEEADVLMLVPHSIAAQAEKRMFDEGLLSNEQVIVASFVRNDGDATPCWLFARATQLRSPSFRDAFLGEMSLHKTLTEDMDTIRVPFRYCFSERIRYPFMNDDPPAIYTACYLWQYIFSELLSVDEYQERLLSGEPLDIPDVSVDTIRVVCDDAGIRIRPGWIRNALGLLVDAALAQTTDGTHYTIAYGKLRARPGGSRELHQQIAERLAKENVRQLDASEDGQVDGQLTMPLPPAGAPAALDVAQEFLPRSEDDLD
ncbi:MAG: hypothetical protein JXA57_00865 [Armatimonadetes bacterium]|nr:hypothetical protein [Armatimonadota bacterium]